MPDQAGRVVMVTGASSGLGAEAAMAFAAKRAQVILAVRDQGRGDAVRDRILRHTPDAAITVSLIDLASLASVRAFAERITSELTSLDVLLNNAGLAQQTRSTTVDGFERVFATDHLGHFALTGLLMPMLLKASSPRVVTVASIAHRFGRIDFDNLQATHRYGLSKAYGQAKLANLMFALELDRRVRRAGVGLASVAAHPGLAKTGFQVASGLPSLAVAAINVACRGVGQNATGGVLPLLYAATMPDVQGGQYWGPNGLLELRGAPAPSGISNRAQDERVRQRLWTVSEELTGVAFPL